MKQQAKLILFTLVILFTFDISLSAKIPEYLKVCRRSDNECLKNTLQSLIPRLGKGSPEFGLPPLDPMFIPESVVDYSAGQIQGKLVVKNSRTYGISAIRVLDVRTQIEEPNFHMEVDVKFPTMFIEGDYKGSGGLGQLPLEGKGPFNISMNDISATWNITGEIIEKKGEKYIEVSHFNMRPRVADMKVYAADLFAGNPELSEAALSFVNQFWPIFYNILLPYVDEGWDKIMADLANQVFRRFPYKDLFPEA